MVGNFKLYAHSEQTNQNLWKAQAGQPQLTDKHCLMFSKEKKLKERPN